MLNDIKPILPFKNFNKETDKKLCIALLNIFIKDIEPTLRPLYLDSLINVYKGNITELCDFLYNNSSFVDNSKAALMFQDFEKNQSYMSTIQFIY